MLTVQVLLPDTWPVVPVLLFRQRSKYDRVALWSLYYRHAVSELPDAILKQDYVNWLHSRRGNTEVFSFCKYNFLFDADAKRRVLHLDVEARQAMVRS